MRASASHGITFTAAAAAALRRRHGRDDHVGGRDRVEAPDDLVAGRLRQAEGRDQRRHADHRAEHGQRRRAPGAPSARRRPRRRGRAAPCAAPAAGPFRRSFARRRAASARRRLTRVTSVSCPSTMRTSRRACAATSSSCVITTSVSPSSPSSSNSDEHRLRVDGVEVAGRLVAQQQARASRTARVRSRRAAARRPRASWAGSPAGVPSRRARARPDGALARGRSRSPPA